MSDDKKDETTETPADKDAAVDSVPDQHDPDSTQSGPAFTEGPDPLAGVKKKRHRCDGKHGRKNRVYENLRRFDCRRRRVNAVGALRRIVKIMR